MTRQEMIDVLIEDRLTEWVFAGNYNSLEYALCDGWKGYDEYTDAELKKEIEMQFEPDDVTELLASSKGRKKEDRKREEDERNGILKDPFE